jgi:hypothetical protein
MVAQIEINLGETAGTLDRRFHFSQLRGGLREICEATFHALEPMEFNKTTPTAVFRKATGRW